jgi:tetratricopeptide (TPR) repeat protein
MGMEQMEQQNFEEALKFFRKSLELKKRSIAAARVYECLLHLNRYDESREYIEMAFMLNTTSDIVAVQYASRLVQDNEKKKATAILRTVLERNPSYVPAKKLFETLPRE